MASELAAYASYPGLPLDYARLALGCWLGFTERDLHP